MIMVYKTYREVLKAKLDERLHNSKSYSLRAFARDLEIAPSRLSEVLSGKQGLSAKAAGKIAIKLTLDDDETEYFVDMVTSEHSRSHKDRELAKIRLQKYAQPIDAFQVQVDAFRVIADWFHLGILELMQLEDFKDNSIWIAKCLNIAPIQAEVAIERLIRLGLVRRIGDELQIVHEHGEIDGGVSSASVRRFHQQILEKASRALTTQPIERREFSTNILSIDQKSLPSALKAIREFENKFCIRVEEQAEAKNSLYCLSIQFFDLLEGAK